MGLAFGTLEVAMPALATQDGDPAAAGILLGAFAGGSLLGGLLYGSRSWPGSSAQRYVFLTAVFAAGMAPLIVAGSIPVMVVLMAVAGLTLAPVAACSFALIEDVAPTGTTIEAFTWLFTANMAGAALGAAAAGAVIHSAGIRAALLIPLCGVAVSFLLALAGRRALASGGERATGSDASSVAGGPDGSGDAHGRIGAEVAVRSPRASGRHGRVGGPRFLAAGLILVAALLGYRARDGRSDSHRRSRRR
jgi:MFS family permease